MNPRARASFCHCPTESSTPSCHDAPSWVSMPSGRRSTTSSAPARPTAASTGSRSSTRSRSPTPTLWRARYSKRKKSWKAPDSRSRHSAAGMPARSRAVDGDPPRRRVVEAAQQLDERRLAGAVLADEGDDRARRQREVDVVEHDAVAAGVGEGHALEAGWRRRAGRAPAVGRQRRRARRRSPRATRAAATASRVQRRNSASPTVTPDVPRQVRSGGEHEHDVAGRRVEPARHPHDGGDVGEAEEQPPARVPGRARPPGGGDGVVPLLPRRPPPVGHRAGHAEHAQLLGRPGRGRELEEVPGEALVLVEPPPRWRARPRLAASTSTTVGTANTSEHDETRVDRRPAAAR